MVTYRLDVVADWLEVYLRLSFTGWHLAYAVPCAAVADSPDDTNAVAAQVRLPLLKPHS